MSSGRDQPISVVMPVHNTLPYLDGAVRSILDQSYRNFELVIYDDASTDGSAERLAEWARRDSRIRLIRGDRNLGPSGSSNRVVALATAPLIARMDADDLSMPDRLERQVKVLSDRPDVGLVGTLSELLAPDGRVLRGPDYWRLARRSWSAPFPHGSIMFRRSLFDAVGGYREQCAYWEDLDFFRRAAAQSPVLVIASPLYRYRQSDTSSRIASPQQERVERALDLRCRAVARSNNGQSYERLLRDPGSGAERRVDPRIFVSLGLLELWANKRPRLVGRLLTRGKLSLGLPTLVSLVWTAWAQVSPSSLRAVLNWHARFRNASIRRKPAPGEVVPWNTPDPAAAQRGSERPRAQRESRSPMTSR